MVKEEKKNVEEKEADEKQLELCQDSVVIIVGDVILKGGEYKIKSLTTGKIEWRYTKTYVYGRFYNPKTGKCTDYENITILYHNLTRWKSYKAKRIELNKLTKPVLDIATKRAEKLKNEAFEKDDIKKWEERDKYSVVIEDMPIYMVPERIELLLRWFSCRYLKINSKIGTQLIIDAYNEYYEVGTKCLICKKNFTSKHIGRQSKYCSSACRQKAYRRRR